MREQKNNPYRLEISTIRSWGFALLVRLVVRDMLPSRIHPNDGHGQGLTPCEWALASMAGIACASVMTTMEPTRRTGLGVTPPEHSESYNVDMTRVKSNRTIGCDSDL